MLTVWLVVLGETLSKILSVFMPVPFKWMFDLIGPLYHESYQK